MKRWVISKWKKMNRLRSAAERSLQKGKIRLGDKTEPWGKPQMKRREEKVDASKTVEIERLQRKPNERGRSEGGNSQERIS